MSFNGDLWTVGPLLRRRLAWPSAALPAAPWSVIVVDPAIGPVRLSGRLCRGGDESVIILVHGLGGSIASAYMGAGARAAVAAGCSALLLNLRGADRSGEDLAAEADPLVPAAGSRAFLPLANGLLEARWLTTGGHLGFPNGLDLGTGGPVGVEGQAVAWMLRRPGAPHDRQRWHGLTQARGF